MHSLSQKYLLCWMYNVDMLDKEMIYVLGGREQDGLRFYQDTQNGTQFKT